MSSAPASVPIRDGRFLLIGGASLVGSATAERMLASAAAEHTVMTRAVSGRPARCLANRFTELGATVDEREIPDYPVAYAAGKALAAAARVLNGRIDRECQVDEADRGKCCTPERGHPIKS